jgi:RNA polymerase sigma-70 factor (ECF subfamily)
MRGARRTARLSPCGVEAAAEVADPGPGPEGAALAAAKVMETATRLSQAIEALPSDQRRIVLRHCYCGTSLSELAAVMGVTRSCVLERRRRALRQLREALG